MKIDLTLTFSKTFCTTYRFDGKPAVEEYIPPYTIAILDNLLDKEKCKYKYKFTSEAKYIPEVIFNFLVQNLDIDSEKYLLGWYSLDKSMEEFFTPTKVEKIYEYMFNHMINYTNNEGNLVLYFESV